MTSVGAYIVLRSLATTYAVLVAVFTLAAVIVLRRWALGHTERSVLHMFAHDTLVGIRTGAGAVAFFVTHLTGFFIRLINSDNTIVTQLLTDIETPCKKVIRKIKKQTKNIRITGEKEQNIKKLIKIKNKMAHVRNHLNISNVRIVCYSCHSFF